MLFVQIISFGLFAQCIYQMPKANGLSINVHGSGIDVPSCMGGNSTAAPCKTLDYVAKQLSTGILSENISISIVPYKGWATRDVNFQNLHNLTILSTFDITRLKSKFSFTNITGLILNLKSLMSEINETKAHFVLLKIEACKDVTIQDTVFSRNRETAILFRDTVGNISLYNLTFTRNKNWDTRDQIESHSGGIEVVFTGTLKASYKIYNCIFEMNTAPSHYQSFATTLRADSEWRGHSLGGGLGIFYKEKCSHKEVIISGCSFRNNKALWGGGLHIMFQGQASNNTLQVLNSNFSRNSADHGGGGVCIRYFKHASISSVMNKDDWNVLNISQVIFQQNNAEFGGGLLILSTYNQYPYDTKMTFMNCDWLSNQALYGSAVVVSPALFQLLDKGQLPVPEFISCHIKLNFLHKLTYKYSTLYSDRFAGIFIVTKSTVQFSGETKFEENKDSALYLNSATAAFSSGSNVVFTGNIGFRGGAIAIYGYSSLLLNQNSSFIFENNTANTLGGAIYQYSEDQHEYKHGRLCFIRHESETTNSSTICISFSNNSAGVLGQSIYSSSLYPCHFFKSSHLGRNNSLSSDVLSFIGNVSFDKMERSISTSSKELRTVDIQSEYKVFPGGILNLSLVSIDELGQENQNIHSYNVRMINNKTVHIDRQFTVRGKLHVSGIQGGRDVLIITQDSPRQLTLLVNVSLLNCPPGFYYDNQSLTCKCTLNGSTELFYYGISSCDSEYFHVNLHPGFWVGYGNPKTNHLPLNLFTAVCPLQFCKYSAPQMELSSNSTKLVDQVCQPHRTGILCGDCKWGYSPFFHSKNNIECGENKLCSFGILFYMLSEMVPVFFLFTIIITLDLSLTSGEVNGFVFYSQVLDSLLMKYKNSNEIVYKALIPSRIFYDIFNFDYFSVTPFSFCLWENATVVDILAFKYVTIVFAIVLIIFLILIFRKVKSKRLEEKLHLKNRLSVINGISAFLVLCYAQCIRTSFYILTPVRLRTQGGVPGDLVALFGGSVFFTGRHLFYSLIAIICIVVIVIIPPFILLTYPLLLHLLALCKLSEHWLVNKVLSLLMINKLKPLIDIFQSCYRDKVRFFSGLYFLYRIVILATFSIAHSTAQFYIIAQLSLCVFLGIHCAVQPYKKKSHNVIDSIMFLLLVIINACTIFIDVYDIQYRENYFFGARSIKFIFMAVRLILIYLPMVAFLSWLGRRLIKMFTNHIHWPKTIFKSKTTTEEDLEFSLEYRLLTNIPLS